MLAGPGGGRKRRLPLHVARGVQRADDVEVREIGQGMPAADTLDVFKEEQVLAVRTVERLHRGAFAGKSSLWACAQSCLDTREGEAWSPVSASQPDRLIWRGIRTKKSEVNWA